MNTLIQWNCQGARAKKDELLELIRIHKPSAFAIQETKLWRNSNFKIPNYNIFKKDGHFNVTPHGGVALLIHETIPLNEISLNTNHQAIALRIHLKDDPITICSIYLSRSHEITFNSLNNIIQQLPHPFIIMGDFNSYNTIWGSESTDARGLIVERTVDSNNLNILNNGLPTRIAYNSESAIDLTIISPVLEPLLQWSVAPTPLDSDHCPIFVNIMGDRPEEENTKRLNIKRADWTLYENSRLWEDLPIDISNISNENLLLQLYDKFNAVTNQSIPSVTQGKFFPKPFWNADLTLALRNREKLYQKFRKTKSIQNCIRWKEARAIFRKKIKETKKRWWIQLASSFNSRTPMSKIYENVRKIQGRCKRKINFLWDENRFFTTVPEIANKLAETFAKVSSNENYSNNFKIIRDAHETKPLNFQSDNNEYYNVPFSIDEFQIAIRRTKNTAPGPDGIFYQMIKNLNDNTKRFLLKMINRFWVDGFFPQQWREATVIAFPKPNKNHSDPVNFRPIALTSTLGKTVERMINNRLTDYLDMNGILSNVQCGCRRDRSTTDHLVRLEASIRKAFAHSEHLITIFFDLQKAYDTTWRFGIMRDLYKMGLRGRLPLYIEQFLKDRYFKVQINSTLSNNFIQQEGVPQGCVLSVTLFAIKINDIANQIPNDYRFHSSLYVDDFQLAYRHLDLNVIREKLQGCLNSVSKWTEANGFTFSIPKTRAMHFTMAPGIHLTPDLYLYRNVIGYEKNFKFLGMVWDSKLDWTKHIQQLKTRCQKSIGFLRSIAGQEWGGDQKILLHLYNILIRSRLDYGCVVYQSASRTTKKLIDPIENECLRIATGAFKSTPIQNLHIIANQMPLEIRRQHLTLKYYIKIRSHIGNPSFFSVVPPTDRLLYINKNITPHLANRANYLIESEDIPRRRICPAFSYRLLGIQTPTWKINTVELNLDMKEFRKSITNNTTYQICFQEILSNYYAEYFHLYTDGSKTDEGVGAAAVGCGVTRRVSLPPEASIFTAELHAIHLAAQIIKDKHYDNFVIFSDSLSALQSLQDRSTKNPISRKLQHVLHDLSVSKTIHMCWIPSHCGILGNERADKAAKSAITLTVQDVLINYKDMFPILNDRMYSLWGRQWNTTRNALKLIKPTPGPWKRLNCDRRKEVILNRLRGQHTWLTHHHLMNNEVQEPAPECPLCNRCIITVPHLLMECNVLDETRRRNLSFHADGVNNPTIGDILGDTVNITKIMNFLREVGADALI